MDVVIHSVHGCCCRFKTPASFIVSAADSLYQNPQPTSWKKFHIPQDANSHSACGTYRAAAGEHLSPFCTSCSPFTLIVAVSRMLMVPPTGCVSAMILPPTRCSLIVNRTAAATVHSLFSENNEVFAPPPLRRRMSDGRLMMALWNVQQGGSTPSWQDFTQKSKSLLNVWPLALPLTAFHQSW